MERCHVNSGYKAVNLKKLLPARTGGSVTRHRGLYERLFHEAEENGKEE